MRYTQWRTIHFQGSCHIHSPALDTLLANRPVLNLQYHALFPLTLSNSLHLCQVISPYSFIHSDLIRGKSRDSFRAATSTIVLRYFNIQSSLVAHTSRPSFSRCQPYRLQSIACICPEPRGLQSTQEEPAWAVICIETYGVALSSKPSFV